MLYYFIKDDNYIFISKYCFINSNGSGWDLMIQLNPPLPLRTPKGDAYAYFLIDYGMEEDLLWVCFINKTGECWTFKNGKIKLKPNYTFDRK